MSRCGTKRARAAAADPTLTADFNLTASEVLGRPATNRNAPTFSVDNLSDDRRRILRESFPLPSTSTSRTHTPAAGTPDPDARPTANLGLDDEWDSFLVPAAEEGEANVREFTEEDGERAKRYTSSVSPSDESRMRSYG